MKKSTVLIVAEATTDDVKVSALLSDLPADDVHVSILVAGPVANIPIYAIPAAPYGSLTVPDTWHTDFQKAGERLSERAEQFEGLLAKSAIEGDVGVAYCEVSLLDDEVAERACLSDFVFLPNGLSESEHFGRILRALLFASPTGVVLNAKSIGGVLKARKPMVAWDRSLAATRAVHRALPTLMQAEEVVVSVFDPSMRKNTHDGDPGVDLAAWLSRHGCNVTVSQYPSGGREIGQAIADKSAEMGADLVVMGGYTHSRIRELWLGGTTQTMVEQTDLPVLLAH